MTTPDVSIYIDIHERQGRREKLEAEGWKRTGQRGSHVKMKNGNRRTTVPVHGSRDLPVGVLKAIQKQTGVKLP